MDARKKVEELYSTLIKVPFGPPTGSDKLINYEYRKKIADILKKSGYNDLSYMLKTPVMNFEQTLMDISMTAVSVKCNVSKENIYKNKQTFYNFVFIFIIFVIILVNIANHKLPLPFADAPSVDELFPEIKTNF